MGYQNSTYYFLIFLLIAASFFAALPFVRGAFSNYSDSYIISEMNRAQSDMYFYKRENGNFHYACIRSDIAMLISKALYELGSGLSCTTNDNEENLALYVTLRSGEIYCVDSSGTQSYIKDTEKPLGHCPNG